LSRLSAGGGEVMWAPIVGFLLVLFVLGGIIYTVMLSIWFKRHGG
jgi:hypothetical protein